MVYKSNRVLFYLKTQLGILSKFQRRKIQKLINQGIYKIFFKIFTKSWNFKTISKVLRRGELCSKLTIVEFEWVVCWTATIEKCEEFRQLQFPVGMNLLKDSNRNTRAWCETFFQLTIKTSMKKMSLTSF